VEILGTRVVRVASGQDAATAGAAAGDGQKGSIKAHAFGCQAIDVWCVDGWVSVASQVSHAVIIRDEDQKVGP
jgi:hypothetical protein